MYTVFHISLYYVNHYIVLQCFINQYMKQHDLAPGVHVCHPYGGVCAIMLLLLGVLSYTYTCETAGNITFFCKYWFGKQNT